MENQNFFTPIVFGSASRKAALIIDGLDTPRVYHEDGEFSSDVMIPVREIDE